MYTCHFVLRDNDPYRVRKTESPCDCAKVVPSANRECPPALMGVIANSDQPRRPGAMSEPTTPPDQPQPTPASPAAESGSESRRDLLSRAQAFLTSPQIRDQDDAAKRKFLTDKGLTPTEVDYLLQGIVSVWDSSIHAYVPSTNSVCPCRCSRIVSQMFPRDRTLNRHPQICQPSSWARSGF